MAVTVVRKEQEDDVTCLDHSRRRRELDVATARSDVEAERASRALPALTSRVPDGHHERCDR